MISVAVEGQSPVVLADKNGDGNENERDFNGDGSFLRHTTTGTSQSESPLMLLATRALKEWQKGVSATDAMIWGAGITNSIRSYRDYAALQSTHGLQRLVVVSAGRPQFKLVHRSITIPKTMAVKYRIGAGPIRARLFVKSKGETWAGMEAGQCFTAAWCDLPQKYRICLSKEHEAGRRPGWSFWYRPSQKGPKAKNAAVELLRKLDDFINDNLAMSSMDYMMNYVKRCL